MEPIVINAGRDIILKQYRIEDAELIFNLTDQNRLHLREWLPWVDGTKTVEDSLHFIEGSLDAWQEGKAFDLGIWYKEQIVGGIGIHHFNERDKNTEIGYWLSKEFVGKGVMTNSVKALVNYIFNVMKLHRVEIRAGVGNNRSVAVPERLHFKFEGIAREAELMYDYYRDLNVFSIIINEWEFND
jgi:ribosomal-protein-serine acetyltransferase